MQSKPRLTHQVHTHLCLFMAAFSIEPASTLQFLIVFSGSKVLEEWKFGPCAYNSVSNVTQLGYQADSFRQSWDPNLWEQVLGPCPCAGQTYWPVAVYEQLGRNETTASGPCPCAGLLQPCCGAKAPLLRLRLPNFLWRGVPKLLMDASSGLVLALQFVIVSCHSLGLASCRLGQELGPRGSGAGPRTMSLAGQIYRPVAVYEYPGRSDATAPGPCPCASLLQACCGANAPLHRLRLLNFLVEGPPKFLMDASSDLVLALRFVVVSCHSLGASKLVSKQTEVEKAFLVGGFLSPRPCAIWSNLLVRCVSTTWTDGVGVWCMSLPVTGLLRC